MKITDIYKALYDVSSKYKKETLEENARNIFDTGIREKRRRTFEKFVPYAAVLIVLAAIIAFAILSNFIK